MIGADLAKIRYKTLLSRSFLDSEQGVQHFSKWLSFLNRADDVLSKNMCQIPFRELIGLKSILYEADDNCRDNCHRCHIGVPMKSIGDANYRPLPGWTHYCRVHNFLTRSSLELKPVPLESWDSQLSNGTIFIMIGADLAEIWYKTLPWRCFVDSG